MSTKKAILIILDGWGIGKKDHSNAIYQANTPCFDAFIDQYPSTTLVTYGEAVGLPQGQMGNSEVGHLNLGAGRVVYQELLRINNAIEDHSFFKKRQLLEAIDTAEKGNQRLHLMGLISDGGIHSHINHLLALLIFIENRDVEVFIHAFTDGRDCDPKSGKQFIQDVLDALPDNAHLATIIGRYYAMDRDNRWERIKKAYDLLVHGIGDKTMNPVESIENQYKNDVSDEFLMPIVVDHQNTDGNIKENDTVICFNFRTDRCRQISAVLTQNDNDDFNMKTISLQYFTMTEYDASFKNVNVIYQSQNLINTIGEVLANNELSQLRIAETEKYPHVTFFFSGGRETTFDGEDRILIPSPKVATYDLQPEMNAPIVTHKCINVIEKDTPDFICLNFANTDMVGHTGVLKAGIKAAETVDSCLQEVVNSALAMDYHIFILADHGNAEKMINEDGSPHTAHTVNPVPLIYVTNKNNGSLLNDGALSDISPSILSVMNVSIPQEMTGTVLLVDEIAPRH